MKLELVFLTEDGYVLVTDPSILFEVTVSAPGVGVVFNKDDIQLSSTSSAIVEFNVENVGSYEDLEVFLNVAGQTPVAIKTFDVEVTPAYFLTITAPAVLAQGSSNQIEVLVTDADGNPVTGAAVNFAVSSAALAVQSGLDDGTLVLETSETTASTVTTGVAFATLVVGNLQKADTDIVVTVSGPLFETSVSTHTVKQTVNQANSSAELVTDAAVTVGDDIEVEIELKDARPLLGSINVGNLVVRLVDETNDKVLDQITLNTNGSATYSAIFSVTNASVSNAHVEVQAYPGSEEFVRITTGAPLVLNLETDAPVTIVIDPKEGSEVLQGGSFDIVISFEDKFGNVVDVDASDVIFSAGPLATLVTGSGFDAATIQTTAAATLVGSDLTTTVLVANEQAPGSRIIVRVTLSGTAISNEILYDLTVKEVIDVPASKALITPSSIEAGLGNVAVEFEIINLSGTAVVPGNNDLFLEYVNPDSETILVTSSSIVMAPSGLTGTAFFTVTEAGTHASAKVLMFDHALEGKTLTELDLQGSTTTFTVTPADLSIVKVAPETLTRIAAGGTQVFTINTTDEFTNVIAGVTGSAVLTGNSDSATQLTGLTSGEFTTNSSGQATFTLTVSGNEVIGGTLTLVIELSDGTSKTYQLNVVRP